MWCLLKRVGISVIDLSVLGRDRVSPETDLDHLERISVLRCWRIEHGRFQLGQFRQKELEGIQRPAKLDVHALILLALVRLLDMELRLG